jgi:hypothetical protein
LFTLHNSTSKLIDYDPAVYKLPGRQQIFRHPMSPKKAKDNGKWEQLDWKAVFGLEFDPNMTPDMFQIHC